MRDLDNIFYRGDSEIIASFKKALTSKNTSEVKRLVQTEWNRKMRDLRDLDTVQLQTLVEVFDYPLDQDTDLLNKYIENSNNDNLCFLFLNFPYWWKHSDAYAEGEEFRIDPDDGQSVTIFSENGFESLRKKIKLMVERYEASSQHSTRSNIDMYKKIMSLSYCFVVGLQEETDSIIYHLGSMIELPKQAIEHGLHNPNDGIRVASTREHFENMSSTLSISEDPPLNRPSLKEYKLSPIWEYAFPYNNSMDYSANSDSDNSDDLIWVPNDEEVYRLVSEFLGPHVSPSFKIWIDFIKFQPASLETLRHKYIKLLNENKYEEYNAYVTSIKLVKASDYLKYKQQENEESEAHNEFCTKLEILNNVFSYFYFKYKERIHKIKEEFIIDAANDDTLVLIFDYDT